MKAAITTGILAMALLGAGCNSYEKERPPVDQLDSRDEGLQSKEIVTATDKMAASILSDPEINARKERLIIVAGHMDDQTTTSFPKDLFIQRLKTSIARAGKGRIQLVENMARLKQMQSEELEPGAVANEPGRPAPGPAGLQPDYTLNGTITELRKQGTSYYYCEFLLTGIKGAEARQIIWTNSYEVKVAR